MRDTSVGVVEHFDIKWIAPHAAVTGAIIDHWCVLYCTSFIPLLLCCILSIFTYSYPFYVSFNHYYSFNSINLSIIIIHTLVIIVYIQLGGTCSDVCLLFNDLQCLKCVDSRHRNGHLRYVHSPVRVHVSTCVCLYVCIYVRVSVLCLIHVSMILRGYRIELN